MKTTMIEPGFLVDAPFQYFSADAFPRIQPVHWMNTHFAVGGWSPLQRLSGMLTAHMTRIAPRNGFTWHPHRGLEIYTWVLEGTLHHEDNTGGEGDLRAGDLQRMFSGNYIEHQELNLTGEPVRVIQIWFMAEPQHYGVQPHYQQLERAQLPSHTAGDAAVHHLIGDGSPMQQHMTGRLTATHVPAGGKTRLEAPRIGEELFLYVTDGEGMFNRLDGAGALGQYDVILAQPSVQDTVITASATQDLHFLSFYLPPFMHQPLAMSN
jgi:redox-sensitive bicupin YhaK (pirin superfamily)